jgi:hypothetical protein
MMPRHRCGSRKGISAQWPGTGRMVWWTGRVAIGLRHQPTRNFGPITQSALWVQNLLLQRGRAGFANA